jgi:hypothetical protein
MVPEVNVNLGLQLLIPDGYVVLKASQRYYFLRTNPQDGMTSLAAFTTQEEGRRVHIERLPTKLFREGLDGGLIVEAEQQLALPPWLARVEGVDLYAVDMARKGSKETNLSRAEKRYSRIHDLLSRVSEIISAPNPFLIINKHARLSEPKQNRQRLAEWFFSYICHSHQLTALWPEYPNTGNYDKASEKYNQTHWGKVSIDKGKHYGWPSAMFAEDIVKHVDDMLGSGKSKHSIWIECLKVHWGCRARMNERGDFEMHQPDGLPFPDTDGKFWYRWYQHLDLRQTNIRLYGEHHVRSTSGTKGPYGQEVCSILSKMEVDAYFLAERPRLTHSNDNSARLCVARGVCVGTKNVVGVGFSLEGETESAYQMMLFCCAIGLDRFARLWGLSAGALLEVFVKGLSPHVIGDRGKAPIAAIVKGLHAEFPVREQTETYSGQSKPNVESGHPKTKNVEGPPEYRLSDKDIIQLIKREICRAAKDNHVRDVSGVVIGDRVFSETVCSPFSLAKYLDDQGLNDGIVMNFDTAVRTFLPATTLELRDGGFWLHDRCYSCPELDETDVYASLSPGQQIPINGYHLPLNLMWCWVEFRGRLYQLQQKLSVRIGEHEKMLTLPELAREAEIKKSLRSEQVRSSAAAEVEAQARYEAEVGVSWGDTSRRRGRPSKNTEAAIEKSVLCPKSPNKRGRKAA